MNTLSRICIPALLLLLAACSGSGAPSQSDIRIAFEQELPGLLELKDLELEQHRNTGSEEQPVWVARIIATLALREATFDIETVEGNVRLLKPVRTAGETFNTYGTVRSERAGDGWRHRFQNDGSSNPVLGRTRSSYGPDALLADSPEARALLAKIAQEKEQARIAEEARLAAEAAERRRSEEAEAAKRKRIEAAVAKYQAAVAPGHIPNDDVDQGRTRRYLVTARMESSTRKGTVYGTDRYDHDSDFPRAVIHSGALKEGETGIVELSFFDEWEKSFGSPRNGIDSVDTGSRVRGYTIRLLERIPSE